MEFILHSRWRKLLDHLGNQRILLGFRLHYFFIWPALYSILQLFSWHVSSLPLHLPTKDRLDNQSFILLWDSISIGWYESTTFFNEWIKYLSYVAFITYGLARSFTYSVAASDICWAFLGCDSAKSYISLRSDRSYVQHVVENVLQTVSVLFGSREMSDNMWNEPTSSTGM